MKTNDESIGNKEGNIPKLLESSKKTDEWGKGVTYGYTWFFSKQRVCEQLHYFLLVKEICTSACLASYFYLKKQISKIIDFPQEAITADVGTIDSWVIQELVVVWPLYRQSNHWKWTDKEKNATGKNMVENGNSTAISEFKSQFMLS